MNHPHVVMFRIDCVPVNLCGKYLRSTICSCSNKKPGVMGIEEIFRKSHVCLFFYNAWGILCASRECPQCCHTAVCLFCIYLQDIFWSPSSVSDARASLQFSGIWYYFFINLIIIIYLFIISFMSHPIISLFCTNTCHSKMSAKLRE